MVFTKEQMKQYRLDNKEHIATQMKHYRIDNKEEIAEYYQDNKAEIQQQRYHSEKQKDTRAEYNAKTFVCECKKVMRNSSRGAHRKVCPLKEMLKIREEYHPKR